MQNENILTNARPFFDFYDRWGTHYVASANVGGRVRMDSLIQTSYDGNQFNLGIGGNFTVGDSMVTFKKICSKIFYKISDEKFFFYIKILFQAINAAKYAFSSSLTAQLSLGYEKLTTNIQQTMKNSWTLIGTKINIFMWSPIHLLC